MIQSKLTILNAKPDLSELQKSGGYALYRHKKSDLFFLCHAEQTPWNDFEYGAVLSTGHKFKTKFIHNLKSQHKDVLGDTIIHDDIIKEAVGISERFKCGVLTSYFNDEECDFAVVADQGKLTDLRVRAGKKKQSALNKAEASKITSDIKVKQIDPVVEEANIDGLYNMEAYEMRLDNDGALYLQTYHHFVEGQRDREYIFKSITHSPGHVSPHQLGRNSALAFEQFFELDAPDFLNLKKSDFEKIDEHIPEPNILSKLWMPIAIILVLLSAFAGWIGGWVLRKIGRENPGEPFKLATGFALIALIIWVGFFYE